MKLADSDSRLGKRLGKFFSADEEKERHEASLKDQPETVLEKKVKQWFTDQEQQERPLIIKENIGIPCKILVITSHRAILFEAGLLRRLKDISDKVWRQFVSVHLTENTFSSTLELRFFRYHDSLFYHNPYKDSSPYMEETEFKLDKWKMERLNKREAASVYSALKDKQLYWQEERRKEHVAQIGSLNAKTPGGPPAKKKE